MNGLADETDLRLRFDVLTKTKQPEFHGYWTTRDRAANRRLFRLVAEVLHAIEAGVFHPNPGLGRARTVRSGAGAGRGIAGGEAQRREDVPARFTVYRSADNGLRV
jgi:hypothetical protein